MAEKTHYEIPLFDVGVEGAGFRIENTPGQLQRENIDQWNDSDIKYLADLVAVVHGTMTPPAEQQDGPAVLPLEGQQEDLTEPTSHLTEDATSSSSRRGVLLVIDFQFLSKPGSHRFKHVEVKVAFGREDDPIGSANDPIVKQIAPFGAFGMDETTQTRVEKLEAHGALQAGWNAATLGLGGSFEQTSTTDTKEYAILSGISWIEGRNTGSKNSAIWDLRENRTLRRGVPPHLRIAILLELPEMARFRADVTANADVGMGHRNMKRKVGAKTGLDSVYFDPSDAKRQDLGPPPGDVDKSNMSACNLGSIAYGKSKTILE